MHLSDRNGRAEKLTTLGVMPIDEIPSDPAEAYLAHVPLTHMVKDEDAQRPFDRAWARYLTENFDRRLIGILDVSERDNGQFAVMDGWHRRHALLGHGFTTAPCMVVPNLSLAEEAAAFTGLNTRRNVRSLDSFFARVTAGDPIASSVHAAATEAGWQPSRASGDGRITAMNSLEKLHRIADKRKQGSGFAVVKSTVSVAARAWGYAAGAANGQVLLGLGYVLAAHEDHIDTKSLTDKLAKYPGGPSGVLGKAKALRESFRSTVPNCVADIVVNVYNSGRRLHRLPGWRTS